MLRFVLLTPILKSLPKVIGFLACFPIQKYNAHFSELFRRTLSIRNIACPFWQFITEQHDLASAYAGSHAAGLCCAFLSPSLSLASYVSLLPLNSCKEQTTSQRRSLWHLNGAVAMGAGVWAMHFLGMVSFPPPPPPSKLTRRYCIRH